MEKTEKTSGKIEILLTGILGCLLMGASDYLMIYGDTAFQGTLPWLTEGAAAIPAGRNALAMALAFPAVVLYAIALMGIRRFLVGEKAKKIYGGLTVAGMTPWLCLHLFYCMILFLFGWLTGKGEPALALEAGEALFHQFVWLVPVGEALMLPPFLYLFFLSVGGKTGFSRWMAVNNPLLFYLVLKGITQLLPNSPFRLAFTNGLMSESMLIWFAVFLAAKPKVKKETVENP